MWHKGKPKQAQIIFGRAIILKSFDALLLQWSKQDAMEIAFREQFDRPLEFYAALYRYAELYSKIDFSRSAICSSATATGVAAPAINPNIKLTQKK